MVAFMYVTVLSANLFLGAMGKRSRLVLAISAAFIIFIISGNDESGDTANYLVSYNGSRYTQSFADGPLFYKAMSLFHGMGLGFYQFKFVCACVILANYYVALKILKLKDIHILLAYYLAYLFFFDAEQFRNALAVSLFSIGYAAYASGQGGAGHAHRKRACVFCVAAAVAAAVHMVMVFYLISFAVVLKVDKRIYRLIPAGMVVFLFASRLASSTFDISGLVYGITGHNATKINAYMDNKVAWGFLVPLTLQIALYAVAAYISRAAGRDGRRPYFVDFTLANMQVLFGASVLYLNSLTFYRVVRNFIPFVFISAMLAKRNMSRESRDRFLINTGLLMTTAIWELYDIFIRLNDIVFPVLTSNYWLE